MNTRTPPCASPRSPSRTWLLALVLLAVAAELLLLLAFRPYRGADIVKLELAASAAEFAATVQRDWTQDAASAPAGAEPPCGLGLPHVDVSQQATPRPHWGKLQCNLLADSVALVPGYVGLLVLLTLGLVPAGAVLWQRLAWAAAPLAAGMADWLENGLTLWALGAWHQNTLTDALVANVRGASQAKWLLLAMALAVLGHVAWHSPSAAGVRPRKLAAGLCVLGALALPLGAWLWRPGIGIGMGAMVLALALLAWRQWKQPPA